MSERPARWCNPNRDVRLDPVLVDVASVHKTGVLEATRNARPAEWESVFQLGAVLAAPDGSQQVVYMNLFAFMMNPRWRGHSIATFIQERLPSHLDYVGDVLNYSAPDPPRSRSPSPQSERRADSPLRILDDDSGIDWVRELREELENAARERGLPTVDEPEEEDDGFDEIREFLAKRRRL